MGLGLNFSLGIEEQIEQEMDEYYVSCKERIDRHGEEHREWRLKHYFMNNIHHYFRDASMPAACRGYWLNNEWADRTNEEWIQAMETQDSRDYALQRYSKLCISQTPRQVLETIDQTVIEMGIDPQLLHDFASARHLNLEEQKTFTEILFPIYLKLREKGYSHFDLTA